MKAQSICTHEQRKIILMCPHCFAMTAATYDIFYDFNHNHRLHTNAVLYKGKGEPQRYKNGLEIEGSCEMCKSASPVILDSRIASTIQILNKKGYKTNFSCHGHRYEKDGEIDIPYISFDDSVPVAIFNALPKGWRLDISGDFISIARSMFPAIDGTPVSIYYYPAEDKGLLRFNNHKLESWASHLPDIKEFEQEHLENTKQE